MSSKLCAVHLVHLYSSYLICSQCLHRFVNLVFTVCMIVNCFCICMCIYMQTINDYFVIASSVEMYSHKCGIKTKCTILQINTYIILNQDAYMLPLFLWHDFCNCAYP